MSPAIPRVRYAFQLPSAALEVPPRLVLLSGATCAGKSTLGLKTARECGLARCVSTDTLRAVLRAERVRQSPSLSSPATTTTTAATTVHSSLSLSSSSSLSLNPPQPFLTETDLDRERERRAQRERETAALLRSSYSGSGDAVLQWRECCAALSPSVEAVVEEAMQRGASLLVEGVHLVPQRALLQRWREKTAGGAAVGALLVVPQRETHWSLLRSRWTHKDRPAEHTETCAIHREEEARRQLAGFERMRAIQSEMERLAEREGWLVIEQHLENENEGHEGNVDVERDPVRVIRALLEEQEKEELV